MTNSTYRALIVRTDNTTEAVDISHDNEHVTINEIVGGWFAGVTNYELGAICYVHDEGLLLGLDVNSIVSGMFGQYLVGDAVLVGIYNADGEMDGESYDLPATLFESSARLDKLLKVIG